MRRSDHGAGRGAGVMRHVAAVGAIGLVLLTCVGCPNFGELGEGRQGEYEITNGTSETLEHQRDQIVPGETRTFVIEEESCEPRVEVLTEDHTRVATVEDLCDRDSVTITEETLRSQAAATIVNDSDAPFTITFTGEYSVEGWALAPGEELVIPILEGTCVSDVRGDASLFVAVPSGPGRDSMVLAHTGALCGGTRWVIDEGTLDAGVATMTFHNTTSFALKVRLETVQWASTVWLGTGESADVSLGVPVGECLNDDLSLLENTSDQEQWVSGTIAGPLCDGEFTITADMLTVRYGTGAATVPLPATETHAALRVVNRTGGELVVELGGPAPYTVSVGADSTATVLLDASKTGCLDASLRVTSVPGSGGATGTAELPGPLCDGDWVVTPDVLAAGG